MIRKNTLMGLMQTQSGLKHITMNDYKDLAGDLLDIIDEHLKISEPSEQLAIEESREADFGCIEPNTASQTKVLWGQVMVSEVQEDRIQIAHRLAKSLVHFFNVPLGDSTISYLVDTYGASREHLEQLQAEKSDALYIVSDDLRRDLIVLPKWAELKTTGV